MEKNLVIRNNLAESNTYLKCNSCGKIQHILEFGVCSKGLLQSTATCIHCIRKAKLNRSEAFASFEKDFSELVCNHHEILGSDLELILVKINSYMVLYSDYVTHGETTFGMDIDNSINSLEFMLSTRGHVVKECTEVRTVLHNDIATKLNRPDLLHNPPCKHLSKSKISIEDDCGQEVPTQQDMSWELPVDQVTKYQHITKSIDPNPNNISIDLKDRIAQNAPGAKETPVAYKPSEADTVALLGGEQALELAQEMYDEALVRKLKIAERKKEFAGYIKSFGGSLTIIQIQKTNELIEQTPFISDTEILDQIAKLI